MAFKAFLKTNKGATTLSIMTLVIITFGIMTLVIITFNIMTLVERANLRQTALMT